MQRIFILIFVLILGAPPVLAKTADTAPATYILQLSSNLGCDRLDIVFISQKDGSQQHLTFGSGAFAAAQLPEGIHAFGDVTCITPKGTQTFDLLTDMLKPVKVSGGKTYYAGRMIFQEVEASDVNSAPEVLSNCTRVISRARGETSNECRDGVGVDGSAKSTKQLNVFVPDTTNEDIAKVRKAISATKEQLVYLPLKV